jgi:exosortase E/protease (VPEID-CTERM system)
MTQLTAHVRPSRLAAVFGGGLLLAAEGVAISLIFKHAIDFECRQEWPKAVCIAASSTGAAIACMAGALALFGFLVPSALRNLIAEAGQRLWPLLVNLAGFATTLLPLFILAPGGGPTTIAPALSLWGAGLLLMLVGAGLWLAPLPRWRDLVSAHWARLLPMAAIGLATPWLATKIRPLWRIDEVVEITFSAVSFLIRLMGYEVQTDIRDKVIGTDAFSIDIAPVCSGIEGIALVSIFVTLYLTLFRHELRFPRALLLYPVGILVSFLLNILRVTVLLAIGLSGNPELAVGGFHSHAGWLMFTIVALGVVLAARNVPWLHRLPAAMPPSGRRYAPLPDEVLPLPLDADPVAARILPFAIFMLSALLASTFSQVPGAVYPLRVLAMAVVLVFFWPALSRIDWRPARLPLLLGAAVGLMWVLIPVPPAEGPPPYGALTGGWLLGWYVLRGIGTVALVPVIEELFFRDYLERRLRRGPGPVWRIGAALVTASLFALLHDRWAEAFVAGLVFSFALSRRGKVVDAIAAHAAANAVVYGVALALGRLEII